MRDSLRMARDILTVRWFGWTGRYTSTASYHAEGALGIDEARRIAPLDPVVNSIARVS